MLTREIAYRHLIAFEPERLLPVLAPTVRAMYENRHFVRMAPCTDFVVSFLASRMVAAVQNRQRFRTYECLRNVRNIMRGSARALALAPATVDLLFDLYRSFIFSENEDVQWCVSTYLKDRRLRDEQIMWLTANAHRSVHLANRLLRYPERNPLIIGWAAEALASKQYEERAAELVGTLIGSTYPSCAANLPSETLVWAAYYSSAPLDKKEKMILSVADSDSAESALKVAMRLGLPNIIRHLVSQLPDTAGSEQEAAPG